MTITALATLLSDKSFSKQIKAGFSQLATQVKNMVAKTKRVSFITVLPDALVKEVLSFLNFRTAIVMAKSSKHLFSLTSTAPGMQERLSLAHEDYKIKKEAKELLEYERMQEYLRAPEPSFDCLGTNSFRA